MSLLSVCCVQHMQMFRHYVSCYSKQTFLPIGLFQFFMGVLMWIIYYYDHLTLSHVVLWTKTYMGDKSLAVAFPPV